MVPINRIVALLNPGSSSMRHLRLDAKNNSRLVDATQGKKTRSIVIMDSNHVILSAFSPDALAQRIAVARQSSQDQSSQDQEIEESDDDLE